MAPPDLAAKDAKGLRKGRSTVITVGPGKPGHDGEEKRAAPRPAAFASFASFAVKQDNAARTTKT